MAVEDIEEWKEELMGLVTAANMAIEELEPRVEANEEAIVDLEEQADSGEPETTSLLIEDYFTVNAEGIDIDDADSTVSLIDPFCVEAGVFSFELSANYEGISGEIMTDLLIDDVVVASSRARDFETPSNISLIYRGVLTQVSTVEVTVRKTDGFLIFVAPMQL